MTRHLARVPVRAAIRPRCPEWLWEACCAGLEPAELLPQQDRRDLVCGLAAQGWTDDQIALLTRETVTVVERIRREAAQPGVAWLDRWRVRSAS